MKHVLMICGLFSVTPAAAQMSVTTIGETDAVGCYQNAQSEFSRSTNPCDVALARGDLTRKDRMKTLVNRGIIHNRNGDIQAAIDDFNAALEYDPDQPEALINRGNSWFYAGRLDDALADYRHALDAGLSKPWMAWYNIGLVHDQREEHDDARAAYEQALALNPRFERAREKLAAAR